ncbi:Phospholipid methyltransferase [uncultured archaeon]|nr:Phospholipid methyltransferase [uncultured archaeon]
MWFIIVVGVFFFLRFFSSRELFNLDRFFLFSVVALANWIVFFSWALFYNRDASKSAGQVTRIVTDGPYRLVRHPIYSADIFLAWGVFVAFPRVNVLASAVWLTVVMFGWMILEENALKDLFDGEYVGYMKKTPRLIPDYLRLLNRN